jgi:hypothetical protein
MLKTIPVIEAATPGEALTAEGYVFVPGAIMHDLLQKTGPLTDWAAFTASWDQLELDTYMADQGRYRKRRHAVFSGDAQGVITRAPHQPHYQGREYNALNGGVERWFAPIEPFIGEGSSLTTILNFCKTFFGGRRPAPRGWHIEVHQFRIETGPGMVGKPTPEGMHRDGVDYVLVLLIGRTNIKSGTTMIHALDGRPLGQFTLTTSCDAALVDDACVKHGVTPVTALNPAAKGWRDVLVVTFKAK